MRTLFLAVALAAALPVSAAAPRRMANPSCTVRVSSPEAPQTDTDRAPRFKATDVEDLRFDLTFSQRLYEGLGSGDHVAELRVFTPRGRLYQTLSVPFTTNAARQGQKVKVDGYPREMLTQVTGIPCHVAENALNCVALGTGLAMEHFEFFKGSLVQRI